MSAGDVRMDTRVVAAAAAKRKRGYATCDAVDQQRCSADGVHPVTRDDHAESRNSVIGFESTGDCAVDIHGLGMRSFNEWTPY